MYMRGWSVSRLSCLASDTMTGTESRDIQSRFHRAVNMTVADLRAWLKTSASRAVGFRRGNARESVGHASGRRIIQLLQSGAQTESDLRHMRKVVGYIARHLKQRPPGDVTQTRWRYSLMNWGHDPLA